MYRVESIIRNCWYKVRSFWWNVSYEQRLSSVIVSLLSEVLATCDFLKRNTTRDDKAVSDEIDK